MRVDRALGDGRPLRDVPVGHPLRDQRRDLEFPAAADEFVRLAPNPSTLCKVFEGSSVMVPLETGPRLVVVCENGADKTLLFPLVRSTLTVGVGLARTGDSM